MFGFSDETYIDVASGNGGGGCVSFRREKFVPKGGPDGGDGGRGGDVVFIVKDNLRTLAHLKMVRTYRAENGHNGSSSRCFGRDGADVEIPVPPGTVIRDVETGAVLKDLTDCDRWVFLKGGKGGQGNWHFKTATRQTPRFAQPGEPGMEMRVGVELQVIADIGFVGFPNAGKSSLMNMLTNARSKVAGYPFTTKIPQLGMMRCSGEDVVLADIPGIIEGASRGAGMGIKFLRHISRTKGLAFLVDLSDEATWEDAYEKLCREVGSYSKELLAKPKLLIGTKIDEEGAPGRFEKLKAAHPGLTVLPLSVYMDETIKDVELAFLKLVSEVKDREGKTDEELVSGGFVSSIDTSAEYSEQDWRNTDA